MHNPWTLLICLVAGSALGAIYFGGLWWTLGKGLASKQSALWFTGSLLLRTSIVVIGFYWLGREHWERYLAGLIGFLLVRFIVVKFASQTKSISSSGKFSTPPLPKPPTKKTKL